MVPVAVVGEPRVAPDGDESVTVKPSSVSIVESAATLTVIVLVASPMAKATLPVGSVPPVKSFAVAALAPLPVTAQETLDAPVVSPERVTVKVKEVDPPPVPSALLADVAAIASVGGGRTTL